MKLKLACADFTFPILPHDQALQLIAMLGLKGVDIGLFEDRSHLQPSTEFKRVGRSAKRLKKRLDDHGLVAADIFLQLALDLESRALNHPRPQRRRQAREAFLKALDYTAECAGKHLTALPGVHHEGESRRDSLARAADELAWRVEAARPYRITFAVEPHNGSFADTPKRAERLVADVPGLTLTLDYGHMVPRGHAVAEVEKLIRHSSHFHARGLDARSGSASMADDSLDWKRVLRVMDRTGYRGWIELEYGGNNITDTVLLRDRLGKLARRR
jgi:sugar phosphate isomerase/epimerase